MSMIVERIRAGLRVGEAADALRISRMTLWRWENEQTFPTQAQLEKMAEVYGCTVEALIDEDRRPTYAGSV